jgi:Tfp pilus assembly protein PilE
MTFHTYTRHSKDTARKRIARAEDGFVMIVVLGVLVVAGLLAVAAFTAANSDINLSRRDATEKQAYYAALAGVQEYEYQMQANPNYWQSCKTPSGEVPQEANENYEVKLLPASTAPAGTKECSTAKPFETMIESKGAAANTFRIESTGTAGKDKRALVATFQVTGFLNYVYYTNYETEDPGLYPSSKPAASGCSKKKYSERPSSCVAIQFTSGDSVNGPMHTNDAADVCGAASFGRKGHSPLDVIEINGGTYNEGGCSGTPTYNTTSGSYSIKGAELIPPASDNTLQAYVEAENEFSGVTRLVMDGTAKTISVTNSAKEVETIPWPKNGLIYVRSAAAGCGFSYKPDESDESKEESKETNCGNVYVSGTYSESLTIGAEDDVIINGSIYPTSVAGKLGSEPSGTVALGLIANSYVRMYHPVSGGKNATGTLYNPWVYAAILSTDHSFVVDNFDEGEELGNLNVYGAIAQDYRGIVGTGGSSITGYIKNYIYDERLAVGEPPYFLSPLNAGWKVARENSPTAG